MMHPYRGMALRYLRSCGAGSPVCEWSSPTRENGATPLTTVVFVRIATEFSGAGDPSNKNKNRTQGSIR